MKRSSHRKHSNKRIQILCSVAGIDAQDNPFIGLLADSITPDADVLEFSWKTFLLGRFDVFHAHWPEHLIHGRTSPFRKMKPLMFTAGVLMLKVRGKPIVWTVHNLQPHRRLSTAGRIAMRAFQSAVDTQVLLTPSGTSSDKQNKRRIAEVVIPHGSYVEWIQSVEDQEHRFEGTKSIHFVNFGSIEPYKNTVNLLDAISDSECCDISMLIVGQCNDTMLSSRIEQLAQRLPNLTAELIRPSDTDLIRYIRSSRIAVLPYRNMHNSGAALLALSAGRPILVPATPTNSVLADEFGDEWVQLFEPPLKPADLLDALATDPPSSSTPDFTARTWRSIGESHVVLYRRLLASKQKNRDPAEEAPTHPAQPHSEHREPICSPSAVSPKPEPRYQP